jgi:hypothetical protein
MYSKSLWRYLKSLLELKSSVGQRDLWLARTVALVGKKTMAPVEPLEERLPRPAEPLEERVQTRVEPLRELEPERVGILKELVPGQVGILEELVPEQVEALAVGWSE